jgi:hypothetical protein
VRAYYDKLKKHWSGLYEAYKEKEHHSRPKSGDTVAAGESEGGNPFISNPLFGMYSNFEEWREHVSQVIISTATSRLVFGSREDEEALKRRS